MPELPDLSNYIESLKPRMLGETISGIRYASNECNYCARCQNQGNLHADRGLSRLLKKDWPKTLEELEDG